MRFKDVPWVILIMIFLPLFTLGISGCDKDVQVPRIVTENKDVLRLSVTGGVILALESQQDLAQGIYEVANELANNNSVEQASLKVVMETVRELIQARPSFQERPPAVRIIVMQLVDTIESRITEFMKRKGVDVPEEIQVLVSEVAGWVRDAASVYME